MTIEELMAVKNNISFYEKDHVLYDRKKLRHVEGTIEIVTSLFTVFAKRGRLEETFAPAYLRVIDTMIDANISEDMILSSLEKALLLSDTIPKENLSMDTLKAIQENSHSGKGRDYLIHTMLSFQLFIIHLKQFGLSDEQLRGCLGEHFTKSSKK